MSDAGDGDAAKTVRVHLLDCGPEEYGDALVLRLGDVSVLVDGAHPADFAPAGDKHPGLPRQIGKVLGADKPPYHLTLLIVTHAHEDHIGCLPRLVKDGTITADWALVTDPDFGWGKVPGAPDAKVDPRTAQVLAGLREEEFRPGPDRSLEQFLADAASLEKDYRGMLAALTKAKTKVVRYGRDDHAKLVKALAAKGVTMRIVGPSLDALAHTTELLAKQLGGLQDGLEDATKVDAELTAAELFELVLTQVDAKSRAGHLVNAMSLVTYFECAGKKLLLTGDMQLAAPGGDKAHKDHVGALRDRIEKLGPFDFAKLAHHGSDNGLNADILDEMSPSIVGICAGEHSEKHPSRPVLELLSKNKGNLKWLRTDHAGGCLIDLTGAKPDLAPPEAINDSRSNAPEDATQIVKEPPPVVITKQATDGDVIEIVARIPLRKAKVSITVDVEPYETTSTRTTENRILRRDTTRRIAIAGGRDLAGVLFVTNADKLAQRVGADASRVVDALRAVPGAAVIANADGADAAGVARDVAQRRTGRPRAVVIVGGHEVVPHQSVNAVPDRLREKLKDFRDPDDFTIWSDDVYGALDEDDIPDVPVSRVPDAGSIDFLATVLAARPATRPATRGGIRNLLRPFAGDIYDHIRADGGPAALDSSSPIGVDGVPRLAASDATYFMLHGDAEDGREFAGEDAASNLITALDTGALPDAWNGTVFAGCCWGALTTQRPASAGSSPSRTVDESLALSFLARGAIAFVGCTGAHWSPTIPPFRYFGGPLHDAFWAAYGKGSPPAQALFEAKQAYVKEFPHPLPNGKRTATSVAIEYKTWRQFTCLGLGW